MIVEELSKEIGLYKSLDYKTDSRMNVFTKAGGNAILFSLIVVGFFISGEQLLFPFRTTEIYVLQFAITFISIMLYSFLHDLIHLLFSKILKIKVNLKFKFGFPYITYANDIEKNWKYYLMLLSPFFLFNIILIPIQIIVSLLVHDWFWLPWIIIIQNFVISIDDIAFVIYTLKYKDSYLQINEGAINIYFNTKEFASVRKKEREKIRAQIQKSQMKKERINQIKSAPKIGKGIYKNNISSKNKEDMNDQDLDDLSKLDM